MFDHSHPDILVKLNNIYNSHFSGSCLWDMTLESCRKFEASFNRSIKIMFGLPYETHRRLIEPLWGKVGFLKQIMVKYTNFTRRLATSSKPMPREILLNAIHDVRTPTGSNMRFIILKLGLSNVNDINEQSIESCDYNFLDPDEDWRVNVIRNVVDIKHGVSFLDGDWSTDALDEMLNYACTS